MFIRFQSAITSPKSGRPLGLFHAAGIAARDPTTPVFAADLIDEHRTWFGDNLPVPSRFVRSSNPNAKGIALSWFRSEACEHIRRARELARLISEYSSPVTMLSTSRPGYVIYSDDVQVAAIPFRGHFG